MSQPSRDAGAAFSEAGCVMCHGPRARGAERPTLIPLHREYAKLARIVREGIGEMPGQPDDVVSDALVADSTVDAAQAWGWLGQVLAKQDDLDDGRHAYRRAGDRAGFPLDQRRPGALLPAR